MEICDERFEKFLLEVYSHTEWYEMDKYGKIRFNDNAPKKIVKKYMSLCDLISSMNFGIMSDEEFDEEWEELLNERN